jgi:beta-glucosidase
MFSKDFIWGVGSAAYQVEGAVSENGRGRSIWDAFSHVPGNVYGNQTGDEACDFYHLYERDLDMLARSGIHHLRFSISWPRIFPDGDGRLNRAGLDFYDRLVEACLSREIEPVVTLYHWDLPLALHERGGWLDADTPLRFAELASAVGELLRGRVRAYYTLNEPQCVTAMGYLRGEHAPGLCLPREEAFKVMHHFALAHGAATDALRAADPDLTIGLASTGRLCYPVGSDEADERAAKALTFSLMNDDWAFTHHLFLDAIVHGKYPNADGTFLAPLVANIPEEDLRRIHRPPDFIGLNVYNGKPARMDGGRPDFVKHPPGLPRTALKWPVTPDVMRYGTKFIAERYGLPIYIAENGQSCNDRVFRDGAVHDADRIDFLHSYLLALSEAIADGTDIRGYFHWSFTDNFEWHSGYEERFGLVYVDYATQRRIPKDSLHWYAEVARTNGESLR